MTAVLLGFNTNGLQNHRLEDALGLLADHGYEAVALTPDVGHLDPLRCTVAEVERVAAVVARTGLRVTIETGARFVLDPRRKHEPTLMTPDRSAVARRLEFTERCAAIGRDLGATVVSFWAGIDRSPGADSLDRLDAGVRESAARIRGVGLTPSLEPEPGMAVATLEDALALRGRLGSEAPGITLDVGHVYVDAVRLAPARRPNWVRDQILLAGPHLCQIHLEDMRWGVHDHLPPGAGDVDFPMVRRTLEESGYDGPVCFELSRSSHEAPHMLDLCHRVWRGDRC